MTNAWPKGTSCSPTPSSPAALRRSSPHSTSASGCSTARPARPPLYAATRRAAVLLLRATSWLLTAPSRMRPIWGMDPGARCGQRAHVAAPGAGPITGHPRRAPASSAAPPRSGRGRRSTPHAIAAGFYARADDLPAARRHAAIVADLGPGGAARSYLWSVGVRELPWPPSPSTTARCARSCSPTSLPSPRPAASTAPSSRSRAATATSRDCLRRTSAPLQTANRSSPPPPTCTNDSAPNAFLADLQPASGEPTGPRPRPFPELTTQEVEVLVLIARGHSNDDIVAELTVSPATVRNHITHIFQKLHVRDPGADHRARPRGRTLLTALFRPKLSLAACLDAGCLRREE